MVERFNGRISSEVLGINSSACIALEQLPCGVNEADNAQQQCSQDVKTPNQIFAQRSKPNHDAPTPAHKPS